MVVAASIETTDFVIMSFTQIVLGSCFIVINRIMV